MNVLEEAQRLVEGDRHDQYGDPRANMTRATMIAKNITGLGITTEQMPLIMVAVKLARLQASPGHRDSVVDAAAYLLIYERMWER